MLIVTVTVFASMATSANAGSQPQHQCSPNVVHVIEALENTVKQEQGELASFPPSSPEAKQLEEIIPLQLQQIQQFLITENCYL